MKDKKTFVTTIRADIRHCATIHKMLEHYNLQPATPSALASMSLDLLGQLAEEKGFPTFQSTAEALEYLQETGVVGPIQKVRNYRSILKALSEEDATIEAQEAPPQPDLAAEVNRRMEEFKKMKQSMAAPPRNVKEDTDE